MALARAGDLIQLVAPDHSSYVLRLQPGEELRTHRGVVAHIAIIGRSYGADVSSHLGKPFTLLRPCLADVLTDIKRNTQIVYPKDIGYILLKLSIAPGQTVLEVGTGSGAMTTALAHAVGPDGHVISYEARSEMQAVAQRNLAELGLADRVTFKLRDVADGLDETGLPAAFVDVSRPYDYLPQLRAALEPGGFLGAVVPTTNQASDLLVAMQREGFGFHEVCEIMLRHYKTVPARLRPVDRMVAHTAYLVFGRPLAPEPEAQPSAD